MTETRVTNEKTGGQKGSKPQRLELVPEDALLRVSEVYGFGAQKYAPNNWRKGYDWSLSYGALRRHLAAFWTGQDLDDESGLPHLAHAAFHVLTLIVFAQEPRYAELDDRPSTVLGREAAAADLQEEGVYTPQPPAAEEAPSWDELEAEPMTGPCPLREVSPDGVCGLADRFPGGYAQCLRSCQVSK